MSKDVEITTQNIRQAVKDIGLEGAKYYGNGMVMVNGVYMSSEAFDKALTKELKKRYKLKP
jgi:hypothetical protein